MTALESSPATKVKICGLQSVEVLKSLQPFTPDYVGFVFAPSRRQVTAEQAAMMLECLPEKVQSVGVFVNPSLEELAKLLSVAELDVIQLHGQENPEFCQWVKGEFPAQKVWKALPASPETGSEKDAMQLLRPYAPWVDVFLIDTYDPSAEGGTGVTFPWERIPWYQSACNELNIPLFIAGGLNPDNVSELMDGYAPYGVDVSSGVETDRVKDPVKMGRFIERVRTHGRRA
jgi:phosphoribosylanthranilate isomerase